MRFRCCIMCCFFIVVAVVTSAEETGEEEHTLFRTVSIPLKISKNQQSLWDREKARLADDAKDSKMHVAHTWDLAYTLSTGLPIGSLFGSAGTRLFKVLNDEYEYPNEEENKRIVVGRMLLADNIIVGPPLRNLGPYRLWQASIPVVIQPSWERITDFADDFSHVGLEFRLKDAEGNGSAAQLTDILPNTSFSKANYGADARVRLALQANRKWGPVEPDASATGSFWYEWNPKVNVVASGAAGSNAFVVLNRKPDKTGWVGSLPVELLLLCPKSIDSLTVVIHPMLVFKDSESILLGETMTTLHFYTQQAVPVKEKQPQ